MSLRLNSKVALPLTAIAAVAFGVVLPFFWLGIPSGHDFEVHFNAWVEVSCIPIGQGCRITDMAKPGSFFIHRFRGRWGQSWE